MYEYEHFVCLLLRRGTGEGAAAAETRGGRLSADSTPGLWWQPSQGRGSGGVPFRLPSLWWFVQKGVYE